MDIEKPNLSVSVYTVYISERDDWNLGRIFFYSRLDFQKVHWNLLQAFCGAKSSSV